MTQTIVGFAYVTLFGTTMLLVSVGCAVFSKIPEKYVYSVLLGSCVFLVGFVGWAVLFVIRVLGAFV